MQSVRHTQDLDRIRLLARRDWQKYDLDLAVREMTAALGRPNCGMPLRPVQAVALGELYAFGGGFWPIQVGGGKTLVSLLAPRVVNAKRPVLLVPASLRKKTQREAKETYSRHYDLPMGLSIQSYQTLSRDWDNSWLEKKAPDLIIADECHYLKNTRAACTKKVSRYLSKARRAGRQVRFVGMSGTASGRALRDFWHLIRWALGDNAPVPRRWDEMAEWGLALDAKIDEWQRLLPGPILTLGAYDRSAGEVEQGRQAFGDRLYHTPGVIVVKGDRPSSGLEIDAQILGLPSTLDEHFHHLREAWETPDGHPFDGAMDLWRHSRTLACGLYYRWDPRPPDEWLDARREWSAYVRGVLGSSRTYDSPAQVALAVDRFRAGGAWGWELDRSVIEEYCRETGEPIYGRKKVWMPSSTGLDDGGALERWRGIRDAFVPNSVPVWVDDTALRAAATWLEKHKGICWVEHRAFGRALAQLTGLPHCQEGGLDPVSNKGIDQIKGPVIAQVKPCYAGFNLQGNHHRNLIVSCEPTGKTYEQLLGRTHRPGQEQDTVYGTQLFGCIEALEGFWQAVSDARFAKETPPSEQKLSYATVTVPQLWETPKGAAWKKGKG